MKLSIAAAAVILLGGAAYAAAESWRPVMPEFVIDVRTADSGEKAPALLLSYSEHGRNPFSDGPYGSNYRYSQCETTGSLCVSRAARHEFGDVGRQPQSLQIRLFNGKGNPIVGGVSWTGSWHPKQVRIICDLRVPDARKSCAIAEVTS
jgi:hypothetical protein